MPLDNIFEQIKNEANIVELIGKRISLKKKGADWVGLCPFHDDNNPSMFVSNRKQLYKCFSCGAGGDVFKFVMEYDKLSFKEAVKTIASLYNIVLPQTFSFRQAERIDRYLEVKSVNTRAANLYHRYLFTAKGGRPGRDYLKKRGLSKEILEVFKIGYTPDYQSGFLTQFLATGSQSKKKLWQKSSLFSSGFNGNRDFFRNRIIFPIFNEKEEVLGFGGRAIGKEEPKYLNVRESPWFHKREILYGFKESYARIVKFKQLYVVEGYLDVIACYEAGIPAVAPLGTSLTRKQLVKLKRYVDRVNLFFDGDDSGKKAAWRSAQDLVSLSMDGKVLILPAGEDPFDFTKKNSPEVVKKFLDTQGVNIYHYLVSEVSHHQKHWSPVEKKNALVKLLPIYSSITDSMVKKDFGEMIGEVFSLNWEKYLEQESNSSSNRNFDRLNKRVTKKPSWVSIILVRKERSFVLFLCNYPHFIGSARPVIAVENLEDRLARYMYKKLISSKDKTTFQEVVKIFEDAGQEKVVEYITNHSLKKDFHQAQRIEEKIKNEKTFSDNIDKEIKKEIQDEFNIRVVILKKEYLKKKKIQINQKIKLAQEKNDWEQEKNLYEEYTAISIEEDNLKKFLKEI